MSRAFQINIADINYRRIVITDFHHIVVCYMYLMDQQDLCMGIY